MKRLWISLSVSLVALVNNLAAQDSHGYSPADIERGGEIFLRTCASCHGPNGDALPGFDLGSGQFRHATTDQDLIRIIRLGIAGTPMPPGNYSEAQAATVVAYLRTMRKPAAATGAATKAVGDPNRGASLFQGKGQCLTCHRSSGQGAFSAPDLTEIGAVRRLAELEHSLLDPNDEIRADNQTVKMVRKDGVALSGRLMNQNTHQLQIITAAGELVSVDKDGLRQFEIMKTSPMPSYRSTLSAQELADLLSYLATLKGTAQ